MALPAGSVLACDIDKRVMANSARSCTASNYFSSTNSGLQCGSGDLYFSFWFNRRTAATNDGYLSKWAGTADEYLLYSTSSTNLVWLVATSGGNKGVTWDGPTTDQWHFIELLIDHDGSDEIRVTVDRGATFDSGTTLASATTSSSDGTFYLNRYGTYSGIADYSTMVMRKGTGAIPSDANRAWLYNGGIGRGADEIAAHATFSDAAENGIWGLQESSGAAIDSGSNGYNLTDNGSVGSAEGVTTDAAWEFTGSPSNKALYSTGVTDMGDSEFSVVALVEPDVSTSERHIFGKWDIASNGRCWGLYQDNSGDPSFYVSETGAYSSTYYAIDTGAGATGAEQVWIGEHKDGQKAKMTYNGSETEATTACTTIHTGTYSVSLGMYVSSGSPSSGSFDGSVGYALYINRNLTAAEKTWLYNGGSFRSYSDIQQAANNTNSPGTGIWADVTHAYVGGVLEDQVGSVDMTNNNSATTRSGSTTSRLLCDVSSAGIDLQDETAPVYRWEDQSGEDHHPTQATYANQTFYDYNSGSPRVGADTTAKWCAATFSSVNGGGSVASYGSFDAHTNYLYGGINSAHRWAMFADSSNTYWFYGGSGTVKHGTLDANPHVFFCNYDTASDLQRIDGSQEGTADVGSHDCDGLTLLNRYSRDTGANGRYLYRIAVFDGIITGTDITDAEEWVEYGDAGAPGGSIIPQVMHHRRLMGVS